MSRTFAHVLVVLMLLSTVSAYAQVVFGPTDIPSTPGTITEYYSESDAEVNLGGSGSNRFWDFTDGSTASMETREILERGTAPFSFLFPSANSVSYGPSMFGLNDGNTWRYDEITESEWTTLGTTLDVDVFGVNIPVPIPIEISVMELPLEYGDSWGMDFSRDMTIPVDIIPVDIPIFDEIRIEVTVGGNSNCDGWGTIAVPGGELEALRVYTEIGADVDAFGIFYIFGFPIEVPFGTIYELNAILSYSWYSPGYGEVAFAMSNPGEPDHDFTQAALLRRINLTETPEILTLNVTPSVDPIEIPAEGGEFGWNLSLASVFPSALHCDVWSTATFPGGDEYFVESVQVTIPANGMIDVADLSQSVPAFVPPGVSSFNVHVGLYPNLIWAQDSFSFTKLATSTNGPLVGGWNSSEGMEKLYDALLADDSDDAVVANEFMLSAAYPNPFNPETTLTLTLPQTAQADVIVYNAMGRQVVVLNQGMLPAGQHNLVFNGSNLSSGVYFVVAQIAGQTSQAQKIVLMK